MAIATITNETIVIPNSTVMKNRITVVARRGEERTPWRRHVPFEVEFDYPPARVITQVEKELAHARIPNVAQTPPPTVGCIAFKDSGIEYAVVYDLTEAGAYWITDSRIRSHIYAALMRQGFVISFPRRIVEVRHDERPGAARREIEHRTAALASMDLFASLTDAERASLARELTTSPYVAGERIFEASQPADSLYLLAQGHVEIVRERDKGGLTVKLATLEAPAYFGEMGLLLGQPRIATVAAVDDALCYRLDKRGSTRSCARGRRSPKRWRASWRSGRRKTMRSCRRSTPRRVRSRPSAGRASWFARSSSSSVSDDVRAGARRDDVVRASSRSAAGDDVLALEQEHVRLRRWRRQPRERHARESALGRFLVVADLDDEQRVPLHELRRLAQDRAHGVEPVVAACKC
jgi:hypothetical protein